MSKEDLIKGLNEDLVAELSSSSQDVVAHQGGDHGKPGDYY